MSDDVSELKQQYARLDLLYQVGKTIHSTLEPQETLRLIVREAVRLTRASSGSVALVNPANGLLEIQAAEGLPSSAEQLKLHLGHGITGWVTREGKSVRSGDVRRDRRYVSLHDEICSELAVPLEAHGEVFGVINVDSDQPDAFTEDDLELLEELAVLAAKAIQHTWLYEQLRLKVRLFESLVSVGQTINSALNLDEALQSITREACQLMGARLCSLLLLDEAREWLDLKACHGAGPAYLQKPRLRVTESLLGTVVRRKKPLQVENVQSSSRYQNVEIAQQEGLISLLSVPLLFKQEAIGTLSVYTEKSHLFSNEEVRVLSALAELSAVAIEKAKLYERIINVEDQLRQNERLSALGLLAAEVAHEIRNPLTVMKMLYHSLDLRFSEDDPRAKDAQIMREKMDHLNRIVEQILDFARTAEPQFAPVEVNRLLDDLGLLTRHKLRNQNVELVRQFASNLPSIQADAGQLEQAFLNLVLNAVQAMPNGGRLIITTRSSSPAANEAPRSVVVAFSDSGEGIPAERQKQSSLLNTSKRKGTGLGLAIVRRVVEAHHGELKIQSQERQGTTITLILPTETL